MLRLLAFGRASFNFCLALVTTCIGAGELFAQTPSESSSPALSAEVAQERLRSLSKVYLATLEVMHDRYFHGERAMVPARAMEDVFAETESSLNVQARWISVNTKAMSISHEPKSDFEKEAASAIAQGKAEFESTIDGKYFLAVPVPLANKCINCHAGMFREPAKKKSFAGLILSTPVQSRP